MSRIIYLIFLFISLKFNYLIALENKIIVKVNNEIITSYDLKQTILTTGLSYDKGDQTKLSFKVKRNLISNSSEFYDLSYEYYNDCLRAGLVYRREFYNDSELEPEDSLMFKITLTPFGDINSPSFN